LPLAHQTGNTPFGASLCCPWHRYMLGMLLGFGSGSLARQEATNCGQLMWPLGLRLLRRAQLPPMAPGERSATSPAIHLYSPGAGQLPALCAPGVQPLMGPGALPEAGGNFMQGLIRWPLRSSPPPAGHPGPRPPIPCLTPLAWGLFTTTRRVGTADVANSHCAPARIYLLFTLVEFRPNAKLERRPTGEKATHNPKACAVGRPSPSFC
jgi:hypothetical protein